MATNFVTGTTPQLGGGNVFTENSLGQWELGGVTGPSVVRRVFDNSDNASSFTPSPGAIITDVICVAPGGGGGGCAASTGRELCAGGGGAGAWARSLLTPADIGASQTLTIPAGGAGGSAGANNGSAASDTSFGSLVVADGGGGGTHAASGDGGISGVGGLEANCTGDETYPGENGERGVWNDAADLYLYGDAKGGSTPWGKGGDSNSIGGGGSGSNAGAGQGYGAGGGGARGHNTASTFSGGAGSEGLIIVTEYIRQAPWAPIAYDSNGNEVLDATGGTASAVNHVDISNAATGNAPSILAAGDDTNIDLALGGKGTGDIVPVSNDGAALGTTTLGWSDLYLADGGILYAGANEVIAVDDVASAVNHVDISNAATGTGPTIAAAGDDTNVDLLLTGKGTGVVKLDGYETGLFRLDSGSASAAAAMDIAIDTYYNDYDYFEVHIRDLLPSVDAQTLYCRVSTDGGSTFDSGASDYSYFRISGSQDATTVLSGQSDAAQNHWRLTETSKFGSTSDEYLTGVLKIWQPNETKEPKIIWDCMYVDSDGYMTWTRTIGNREAAQDTTDIRFLSTGGNITGAWVLYGGKE